MKWVDGGGGVSTRVIIKHCLLGVQGVAMD